MPQPLGICTIMFTNPFHPRTKARRTIAPPTGATVLSGKVTKSQSTVSSRDFLIARIVIKRVDEK